ncbi:RNA-dependent RNA polymerase [Trichopria drosophilae mononega-like virus]|uniref:RNA-directed RNA polymerase n=2 Tax=Chuviridae TaxID=2501952 RepID=A0A916LKV7_9VIRU|nr:RNA-dependent RNA polymerase [Trichopria drosophilae mononega-like virus]DAZ90592.1 TPA_asm: RNA-dependent RNA polymerase [Trichopria drosophilae mononega-like virus]
MINTKDFGQRKVTFSDIDGLTASFNLKTALRSSTCEQHQQRILDKTQRFDDEILTSHERYPDMSTDLSTTPLYPQILLDIIKKSDAGRFFDNKSVSNIRDIAEIIAEVIDVQYKYMTTQSRLPDKLDNEVHKRKFLSKMKASSHVCNLLTFAGEMENLLMRLPSINDPSLRKLNGSDKLREITRRNHCYIESVGLEIIWSNRLTYMQYRGRNYLLPIDYLRLLHTKPNDLVSVLLYVEMAEDINLDREAFSTTIQFVTELCRLAYQHKNNMYMIVKCLEGLVIGETLLETDSWSNTEFLYQLQKDLMEGVGFEYNGSEIQRILRQVSIPFRHELGCLSKIVGHPLVDMKKGAETLREKTTEQINVTAMSVVTTICYIKENFIRNYIVKHKSWPPVTIHEAAPEIFSHAQAQGKDPNAAELVRRFSKVDILDYIYIELEKVMELDKLENFIPYIKDKTVSLLKTRVVQDLFEKTEDRAAVSWKETRLLLWYLLNPKEVTNHIPYVDDFALGDDLAAVMDYLIIRVVPKEGELKILFRGFGCRTPFDRARGIISGANAKKFLGEYSDEQAMTLSELELIKKLYTLRSIRRAYRGHTSLCINIDASSWNNRFRAETVDSPLSQTLSKIFGNNIFSKVHQAFQNSLIYVPDGDKCYYWFGQDGGIEGLNQDEWVVVYLGQLKAALSQFQMKYYVLCKGDDVRVICMIPPVLLRQTSIKELKEQIISAISKGLGSMGHKIKLEDSYASESYSAFSKASAVGTIELPMVFRKITKCHGANNAFIRSLDEYVGSAFSSAHSSCKTGPTCISVYAVALFWALRHIKSYPAYDKLTMNEFVALMLTPSVVGGFPLIYLHNMYVRAESDLLSPFIGILAWCKTYRSEIADAMQHFAAFPYDIPESLIGLFKDPYSIPLSRPQLPSTKLRSAIIPVLKRKARNEDIKKLLNIADSEEQKKLVEVLGTCVPLDVKVAANIYAATPRGIIDEITRKFETGRSVLELLVIRYGRSRSRLVMRRVYSQEQKVQTWRAQRVSGKNTYLDRVYDITPDCCPAQVAQEIRVATWGKPITGITMAPLQHLLGFIEKNDGCLDGHARTHHFTFLIKEANERLPGRPSSAHYEIAGVKPFLGYTTPAGTTTPTVAIEEKDFVVTKLKNLLELLSWTNFSSLNDRGEEVASNLEMLIFAILRMYTNVPIQELKPFVGRRKGGTREHHLRAPSYRESIVPNTLSNIYQSVVSISNSHLTFRTTTDHFSVNFLHCMCYTIHLATLCMEFRNIRPSLTEIWCVTTNCGYCSRPLHNNAIICRADLIPKYIENPLEATSVGAIATKILKSSASKFGTREFRLTEGEIRLTFEQACIGVLQELYDHSCTLQRALQDRYDSIAMGEDLSHALAQIAVNTRQRDVGISHLKNITALTMLKSLMPKIFLDMHNDFPGVHEENVSTVLGSVPGTELRWHGVVKALDKSGRLTSVIAHLRDISGLQPPNCYNNPSTAAQYIGIASFQYMAKHYQVPYFVLLSYYDDEDILRHLIPCVFAYVKRLWKKRLTTIRPYLVRHHDDYPTAVLEDLALGICLLSLNIYSTEIRDQLLLTLKRCNTTQIQVLDVGMINAELLETTTIEEFTDISGAQDLVNHVARYPRAPWQEALDTLHDKYDEITDRLGRIVESSVVNVTMSDEDACLDTVRNQGESQLDEIIEGIRFDPRTDLDEEIIVRIPHHRKQCMLTTTREPVAHHDLRVVSYDFVNPKVIIRQSVQQRLFGHGTSSVNKVAEIMQRLGLDRYLGRGLNIACLGEGYGGILNMFALQTVESIFLYDTLPPNQEIETYPELARNSLVRGKHMLFNAHHMIGMYDLSDVTVLQYFERNYVVNYNFVVCDAEHPPGQVELRLKLVNNVTRFYPRNSKPHGILILKMYGYEHSGLTNAISMLEKACEYVAVMRCSTSHAGGELYVVASGIRRAAVVQYHDPILPMSVPNVVALNRYLESLHKKLENIINNRQRFASFKDESCLTSSYYNDLGLHYQIVRALAHNVRLSIDQATVEAALNAPSWQDALIGIEKLCKRETLLLRRMFEDTINTERHHATWDVNTLTHRLVQACQLLTKEGYRYASVRCRELNGIGGIREKEAREVYIKVIETLPDRLQLTPVTAAHYKPNPVFSGVQVSPYESFVRGIEACMLFCSTRRRVMREAEMQVRQGQPVGYDEYFE